MRVSSSIPVLAGTATSLALSSCNPLRAASALLSFTAGLKITADHSNKETVSKTQRVISAFTFPVAVVSLASLNPIQLAVVAIATGITSQYSKKLGVIGWPFCYTAVVLTVISVAFPYFGYAVPTLAISFTQILISTAASFVTTLLIKDSMTLRDHLLEAIKANPLDASKYYTLALTLTDGESIKIGNEEMTKRKLFCLAAKFGSAEACYTLALMIEDGSIQIGDREMSKRELLYKAAELGSLEACLKLLSRLEETFTIDGREITKADLIYKAAELGDYRYYSELFIKDDLESESDDDVEFLDDEERDFGMPKFIGASYNFTPDYIRVALALGKNQTVEINNKEWNKTELICEAISLNPIPYYYIILANAINFDDQINIDGKEMTKQDLYVKGIQLIYVKIAEAYEYYTQNYDGEETTNSHTLMNKHEFYAKAIRLFFPKLDQIFVELGNTLNEDTIVIDNEIFSAQKCYITAAQINPQNAFAYNNIGVELDVENISINNIEMTEQELYLKAIELKDDFAEAFNNLANVLTTGETVNIKDKAMSKIELYIEALRIKPHFALPYLNLAEILREDDKITINDEEMTKQKLFDKAIELKPSLREALEDSSIKSKEIGSQELVIDSAPSINLEDKEIVLESSKDNFSVSELISACFKVFNLDQAGPSTVEDSIPFTSSKSQDKETKELEDLGDQCFGKSSGDVHKKQELVNRVIKSKEKSAEIERQIEKDKGTVEGKKDLLLQGLESHLKSSENISQLIETVSDGEAIKIGDKDLQEEQIETESKIAEFYGELGRTLKKDEMINVGGKKQGSKLLFEKAIEINETTITSCKVTKVIPADKAKELKKKTADLYCDLAKTCEDLKEKIECWKKALKMDKESGRAYYNLGYKLSDDGTVEIPEIGDNLRKLDLFLLALNCGITKTPAIYYQIARLISNDDTIPFGEKELSKRDLLNEALTFSPTNSELYYELAKTYENKRQKQEHLLKAIEYDRKVSKYWSKLARTLDIGEFVFVGDRKMFNKDLKKKAKEFSGDGGKL